MVRQTLLPPPLNPAEVERLSQLADQIVDAIDSGADPTPLVVEFNASTNQHFTAQDFLVASETMNVRTFVELALALPVARTKRLSNDELLELITCLMNVEGTEYETAYWLELLEQNVPHPHVSDLIYWAVREMTPEEILAEALAYKPIITPPPAD